MRKTLIKTAGIITILVFILSSCTKKEQEQKQTLPNPPLPHLDPEFLVFETSAEKADTINIKSGTKIFIPQNGFYDTLGGLYKGKISIKYREFNNALDIYLAGIPMEFYTMGQRKQMITAGMFEIRAYDSIGNKLQLKDKSINIRYASKTAGDNYNFFGFNQETNNWEFLDYPKNEVNPEIKTIKENIKQIKPKDKFPFGKEYFVFNYDAIADIHLKMRRDKIYKWYRNGRKDISQATRKAEKYGLVWSGLHNHSHFIYYNYRKPIAMMVWKHISGDPIIPAIKHPYYLTEVTKRPSRY